MKDPRLDELRARVDDPQAAGSTSSAALVPARRHLEPIDVDTCLHLLAGHVLGRLGFVDSGGPQIIPMNYVLHHGSVTIRTDYGRILDIVAGTKVAFEVDEIDRDSHSGWSVVVRGRAEEVWMPAELQEMRELSLRPWAPGDRAHYLRIASGSITGRRVS